MSRNNGFLTKQQHIPVVGVVKQLLSGAVMWVTLLIFVFSAVSAWNTSTMTAVRNHLPWLNLAAFAGIIAVGLAGAMWLEHKWIQPSILAYWNRMAYDHNNPLVTDVRRLEQKVDLLLATAARENPELAEELRRINAAVEAAPEARGGRGGVPAGRSGNSNPGRATGS